MKRWHGQQSPAVVIDHLVYNNLSQMCNCQMNFNILANYVTNFNISYSSMFETTYEKISQCKDVYTLYNLLLNSYKDISLIANLLHWHDINSKVCEMFRQIRVFYHVIFVIRIHVWKHKWNIAPCYPLNKNSYLETQDIKSCHLFTTIHVIEHLYLNIIVTFYTPGQS